MYYYDVYIYVIIYRICIIVYYIYMYGNQVTRSIWLFLTTSALILFQRILGGWQEQCLDATGCGLNPGWPSEGMTLMFLGCHGVDQHTTTLRAKHATNKDRYSFASKCLLPPMALCLDAVRNRHLVGSNRQHHMGSQQQILQTINSRNHSERVQIMPQHD